MKGIKPRPPPMRHLHPVKGWVNELDMVLWYTEMEKLYPHPITWMRLFLNKELKKAYEYNKEMYGEQDQLQDVRSRLPH